MVDNVCLICGCSSWEEMCVACEVNKRIESFEKGKKLGAKQSSVEARRKELERMERLVGHKIISKVFYDYIEKRLSELDKRVL